MSYIFGPYYSIGPTNKVSIDASTVQAFLTGLKNALLSCNWSVVNTISGSGGTTGYKMLSFPVPASGMTMKVSFWWAGDTAPILGYPYIKFQFSDFLGIYLSTAIFGITISSGKTVKVIAGPHQFFTFCENSQYINDGFSVNDVQCGVPVLSLLNFSPAYWAVWGNSSFRQTMVPTQTAGFAFLLNGIFRNPLNGDTTSIGPQLMVMRGSELLSPTPFFDGNYPVIVPRMCMGTVAGTCWTVPIWDAIVLCANVSTKFDTFADLHFWESYTLNGGWGSLVLSYLSASGSTVPGFSY